MAVDDTPTLRCSESSRGTVGTCQDRSVPSGTRSWTIGDAPFVVTTYATPSISPCKFSTAKTFDNLALMGATTKAKERMSCRR